MIASIFLAISIFAVTNIDDMLVLVGFLSDSRFTKTDVFVGQLLGMAVLVGFSLAVALVALALPYQYIGFLGLAPIAIGICKLPDLWKEVDDEPNRNPRRPLSFGGIITVFLATIANGGDNIGVYAPVFAVHSSVQIMAMVAAFLFLTLIWCMIAALLVTRSFVAVGLGRYGPRVLPLVLIALGAMVIVNAGTLTLF